MFLTKNINLFEKVDVFEIFMDSQMRAKIPICKIEKQMKWMITSEGLGCICTRAMLHLIEKWVFRLKHYSKINKYVNLLSML